MEMFDHITLMLVTLFMQMIGKKVIMKMATLKIPPHLSTDTEGLIH